MKWPTSWGWRRGRFSGARRSLRGTAAQPLVRGVSSGDVDEVWFLWDGGGGPGSMTLKWSGALVSSLTVTFG